MARFGVKDFELPEWMQEKPEDDSFGVLPENWEAAQVFMRCFTQWQTDARGTPVALRYEGVDVVMRRVKLEDPDDAFARLQIIEGAAAREFIKNAPKVPKAPR